jgi:hypothetical protein
MKDLGLARKFLGMTIIQSERSIKLDLKDYIMSIVNEFGFEDANAVDIPMVPGFNLTDDESAQCDGFKYRSLIGKLMFGATTVRADIAHAVSVLSRCLANPTQKSWKAAVRVLKYLKGTDSIGLVFEKHGKIDFDSLSDASWAGDRKSTSGFVTRIGGTAIIWKSKKQPIVALSSTEAEYIALTETAKGVTPLITLFRDLSVNLQFPVIIHKNNISAVLLSKHSAFHQRTKHIDTRYHYIREKVEEGIVKIEH